MIIWYLYNNIFLKVTNAADFIITLEDIPNTMNQLKTSKRNMKSSNEKPVKKAGQTWVPSEQGNDIFKIYYKLSEAVPMQPFFRAKHGGLLVL